jgi:hypothetical protein
MGASSKGRYSRAEAPRASLRDRILRALHSFDGRNGAPELVSLVDLRAAIVGVPRASLDAALLAMRRDRSVDLKLANSPMTLSPEERAACILVQVDTPFPHDVYLCYAVVRE